MSRFRNYLLSNTNPKYLRSAKLAHVALFLIQEIDFLLDPIGISVDMGKQKQIESGHCSLSTLSFFTLFIYRWKNGQFIKKRCSN